MGPTQLSSLGRDVQRDVESLLQILRNLVDEVTRIADALEKHS